MRDKQNEIDWSLTPWEGRRRAQLRRALAMTLRERVEALEDLAVVARRFQELRAQGAFRPVSGPRSEGAPPWDDVSHP
jgi:hypothetical protein